MPQKYATDGDRIGKHAPAIQRQEMRFENQALLAPLFGQFDGNLVLIESRVGVFISARGDRLIIEGTPHATEHARNVLNYLYDQLAQGKDIDNSVINAAIKMTGITPTADEQSELPVHEGAPKFLTDIRIRTRRKTITPRSERQAHYMAQLASADIIFALGPAGTGKTYLAVAQAVSQLITGSVARLILSRPAVEAGERLGFLPGDMKDKVDPYLRPLYDALYDCMPPEQVDRRIASGEIEIAPIAFMRGRTLADAFVILDEAQNTTREQMKMFLTRFGENSRMVVCGDPKQIDIAGGERMSGLADAVDRLSDVDGIAVTRFSTKDVVRHPIVGRIVEAYEGKSE